MFVSIIVYMIIYTCACVCMCVCVCVSVFVCVCECVCDRVDMSVDHVMALRHNVYKVLMTQCDDVITSNTLRN